MLKHDISLFHLFLCCTHPQCYGVRIREPKVNEVVLFGWKAEEVMRLKCEGATKLPGNITLSKLVHI
jgi:hypothetical protein